MSQTFHHHQYLCLFCHEHQQPRVIRPKVDTQEPTSPKEVEPQEPDFPHDNARSEKHHEVDIIKDMQTMLKGLAHSILATTS